MISSQFRRKIFVSAICIIITILTQACNGPVESGGGATGAKISVKNIGVGDLESFVSENGIGYVDHHGASLLHLALYASRSDLVSWLLENGADVNTVDVFFKQSPILVAVDRNILILEQVILAGANLNFQDENGKSALSSASSFGRVDSVAMLLKHGAEIDVRDKKGWTALFHAVHMNHKPVVKALLDQNADVKNIDVYGKTVFDIARYEEDAELLEMLTRNSKDFSEKPTTPTL